MQVWIDRDGFWIWANDGFWMEKLIEDSVRLQQAPVEN